MAEPSPGQILLKDPLSEVTRKERRTLLGVSAIGILMVETGLVPTKISALGIEFSLAERAALLKALAAVVIYFLAAFFLYAGSDFLAWRLSLYSAVSELRARRSQSLRIGQEGPGGFLVSSRIWSTAAGLTSVLRASFEFLIPVLVAIYAIMRLFRGQ